MDLWRNCHISSWPIFGDFMVFQKRSFPTSTQYLKVACGVPSWHWEEWTSESLPPTTPIPTDKSTLNWHIAWGTQKMQIFDRVQKWPEVQKELPPWHLEWETLWTLQARCLLFSLFIYHVFRWLSCWFLACHILIRGSNIHYSHETTGLCYSMLWPGDPSIDRSNLWVFFTIYHIFSF